MNILIAGGSGLIGSSLYWFLTEKGYNTAILSRKESVAGFKSFKWNPAEMKMDNEAIDFADVIINLTGENISGKRWTKSQKRKIVNSRTSALELLNTGIKTSANKPKLLISASAIGYYGTFNSEKIFTEEDKAGNDFLAKTVVEWERAADKIEKTGLKIVKLRIGVVLSEKGGALPKMLKPVKMGIGSALGSGKQYIPWISINDLCELFLFVIENDVKYDVYNAVSSEKINSNNFMKTAASILNKPFFMPAIPGFILKWLYGEMSSILLYGSRISNKRIKDEGFEFSYDSAVQVIKEIT